MKFLAVGDHNFGDRDRETDLVYRTLSMILHSSAKRNEDDLVVYTVKGTYLSDVIQTICESLEGEITYEQNHWPQASPGPTTTHLVFGGEVDLKKILDELDPEVDYIGCFSDNPVECSDRQFIKRATEAGHAVGFVHSGYGSVSPPPALVPYDVVQELPDGSVVPADTTPPW